MSQSEPRPDFFVSYTSADLQWAEWISDVLEEEGFVVCLQAWDFRPGGSFPDDMQRAIVQSERTIAVLSGRYLAARFTQPEWQAAFAADPRGEKRKLVPVRIEDFAPEGIFATRTYIDLAGKSEDEARAILLAGIRETRAKPLSPPAFPGSRSAHADGRAPVPYPPLRSDIWNIPVPRNPAFTGREEQLGLLEALFQGDDGRVVVQAITGLGGLGKSQLALEYAHRHAGNYDIVWWLRAETELTLIEDYAALAEPLGIAADPRVEPARIAVAARKQLEREQRRWLLVFDNAVSPEATANHLPQAGTGHVLITSRDPNWRGLAKPLELSVLTTDEGAGLLITRSGQADEQGARVLAEELGALPLALVQAAAVIESTGTSLADYMALFKQRRRDLLTRGKPLHYPETVATTWNISFATLQTTPEAVAIFRVAAFLAPTDIPRRLFAGKVDGVSEPLRAGAADPLALADAFAALRRAGVIDLRSSTFSVHRLVQAVGRESLTDEEIRGVLRDATLLLLPHAQAFDPDEERTWAPWYALVPHALALAAESEQRRRADSGTAALLNCAGRSLMFRAHLQAAAEAFERALRIDERIFGQEDPSVATDLNYLGIALRNLGQVASARAALERALRIDAANGKEDPNVARDLESFGHVLGDQGDLTGARAAFERALKIDETALGPNDRAVARFEQSRGRTSAAGRSQGSKGRLCAGCAHS
jgi:TIR domain/Tetratricopeptide repeat/NB-ARC domain